MRILIANNYYYLRGGSERVMFDETRMLETAGHEIIAFSRLHSQNLATRYDTYFSKVVDHNNLSSFGKIKAAPQIVYSGKQKSAITRLMEISRPDILHGHNIYGGLTFSIVDAAYKKNIPVVLTLHDFKLICPSYLMLNHGEICESCLGGRFWHCVAKKCHKDSLPASLVYSVESYLNYWGRKYDHVSALICPSRFILNRHLAGGFSKKKLFYLPNALDPSLYKPSFEAGKYALFVGRLSKEKGVFTLLKAFENLSIPLRIVGSGPIEQAARQFVEAHDMRHVVFEGYQSGSRLQELYRQAAFLVIPSEWYENAPMSILEAFAYGKAVIGSDLGGIPELVVPDWTGLLCQPGDIKGLADCIDVLWRDKGMKEVLGANARKRIEREFSLSDHVKFLLEIYKTARSA